MVSIPKEFSLLYAELDKNVTGYFWRLYAPYPDSYDSNIFTPQADTYYSIEAAMGGIGTINGWAKMWVNGVLEVEAMVGFKWIR